MAVVSRYLKRKGRRTSEQSKYAATIANSLQPRILLLLWGKEWEYVFVLSKENKALLSAKHCLYLLFDSLLVKKYVSETFARQQQIKE